MPRVKITMFIEVPDEDIDLGDLTGLTEKGYGEYVIPLFNMGYEDVETEVE